MTGQVIFQGQPLKRGSVIFNPVDPQLPPARGVIRPDGTFQLTTYEEGDGAALGEHKVVVNYYTEVPPGMTPETPGYQSPRLLIPPQYANLESTPLSYVVTHDENAVEFKIDGGP